MAVSGFYKDGTIAVTNGSANVTGTGTTWSSSIQAGDEIAVVNVYYEIASVTSDTALVLVDNYAGTTASGLSYRIRRTFAGAYAAEASRQIQDTLTNGTIGAYAGANPGTDEIVYGTGTGTASSTSLTSAARTLIAATSSIAEHDIIRSNGADVASATTVDLDAATGPLVDVTGTVTSTAITLAQGKERIVRCVAAWPITASASLIVDGATSGTTTFTANDILHVTGYASSVVRVWKIGGTASSAVNASAIQTFTASGTYTPNANLVYAEIYCFGAGGGGGGAVGASGSIYSGGGGGGGSKAITFATAATIGASQTVTIGTGGTVSSGAAGNAGGDTSVGTLCIGKGGAGGSVASSAAVGTGGNGGVAGTGDVTPVGWSGGSGLNSNGTVGPYTFNGRGGNTEFGAGGKAGNAGGGATASGLAGNKGAGGGGGSSNNVAANASGGGGGNGFVLIIERLST